MKNVRILFISIFITSLALSDPYKPLDIDFLKSKKKTSKQKKSEKIKQSPKKKDNKKTFEEAIKGYKKSNGLFPAYYNSENGQAYLEISEQQLDKLFLVGFTRQGGDLFYFDGGSMLYRLPFMFKRVGEKIQLVNKNLKFRADEDEPFSRTVNKQPSNSIFSVSKIASKPHPETGNILVDATSLFITDIEYIQSKSSGRLIFDSKNSYFEYIKSFPKNTEIELNNHFISKKPSFIPTIPNSRSMILKYHITISEFPSDDYVPRIADERIGHFQTIYQDYSTIEKDDPYVRYVNRWDLKKKNPYAKVSDPVEPIVYWIENTVPEHLRPAIKEGIEGWNIAFENAGISNAIIAKQMPDNADWDPADVRYNVVRWILRPGSGYAVGPSMPNPLTGEIYDADIRISADFVRSWYKEFSRFIDPLNEESGTIGFDSVDEDDLHSHSDFCNMGESIKDEMTFSWDIAITAGMISGTNEDLEEFIYDGLVRLVMHEVGHTLGLRHNFKASTIFSPEQLSDKEFVKENGTIASVMDYAPANTFSISGPYWQTVPGVYDMWAIEYAYGYPEKGETESEFLNRIASRNVEYKLKYGTDYDTFGLSTRGIDPNSNVWDLSSDPIEYYRHKLDLVHRLWNSIPEKFESDGKRYVDSRDVFLRGLRQFGVASRNVSKFIGGIYHSRHHIGESESLPLDIVPRDKQLEALTFIDDYLLGEDTFNFSPSLLKKLAADGKMDFTGSVYRKSRIDYPIHNVINYIQAGAMYRLYHPRALGRIQDNEIRVDEIGQTITMQEFFSKMIDIVWSEMYDLSEVTSFRRNLQQNHVTLLITIMMNKDGVFSKDASSLARKNLKLLYSNLQIIVDDKEDSLDGMSVAHYNNCLNKIHSAYKAQMIIQ